MEDGFPKFIAILSCNLRVNKEGMVPVVIDDSHIILWGTRAIKGSKVGEIDFDRL